MNMVGSCAPTNPIDFLASERRPIALGSIGPTEFIRLMEGTVGLEWYSI
jgi:hypothetical protein